MTPQIKTIVDLTTAIKNNKNVLIKCMTQVCGPCKKMVPIVSSVLTRRNVDLFEIDIENCDQEVVEKMGVRTVPTFVKYTGSIKVDVIAGMQFAPAFSSWLDKNTEV